MKRMFFLAFILVVACLGCRNEPEQEQQIDQVLNIYIDSAGQDMLNAKIANSYTSYSLNDVYGETDTAPVSMSLLTDTDTLKYLEYLAGATRILLPTSTNDIQYYQSKIAFNLNKTINSTSTTVANDTLVLDYVMTPSIFRIDKAYYNNQLVFTKGSQESNLIKILK